MKSKQIGFLASNEMIAVLVAVKTELDSVLGNVLVESVSMSNGFRLISGRYAQRDILLVQTGVGKVRAQAATRFILANYPISAIINLGFGGALKHDLGIGDLVLCHKIQFMDSKLNERSYHSDQHILDRALHALSGEDVHLLTGDCVTVSDLLTEPYEKESLGTISQADVADMESFWIAEIAAENSLKFLAARAISDTITERLPPFDRFIDSDAKWQLNKVAYHFISRPMDLARLPQIYLHAANAGRSLNKLFRAIIPEIEKTQEGKQEVPHGLS